jgi:hypothetical protein
VKGVIAAWLLVIGIGAASFGILSLLKRNGIGPDDALPPGHWSMPRLQESWPDEGAERPFLMPVIPQSNRDESIDMTLQSAAGALPWRLVMPCVTDCAYLDHKSDVSRERELGTKRN